MKKIKPLETKALCTNCNPRVFSFASTNEIDLQEKTIIQERAEQAMKFGIQIAQKGFILF